MVPWLNLGEMLKVNAAKYPDRVALCDRDTRLTYPQLNARVNKLSNALLDAGLKKGDKVAVLLENCLEIVEIYLACAKTGIIIVPINFRLTGHEVRYIVENSEASAMIASAQPIPEPKPKTVLSASV